MLLYVFANICLVLDGHKLGLTSYKLLRKQDLKLKGKNIRMD